MLQSLHHSSRIYGKICKPHGPHTQCYGIPDALLLLCKIKFGDIRLRPLNMRSMTTSALKIDQSVDHSIWHGICVLMKNKFGPLPLVSPALLGPVPF